MPAVAAPLLELGPGSSQGSVQGRSGRVPPRLPRLCHQPAGRKSRPSRSALLAVDGIVEVAGRSWPSRAKPMPATATDRPASGQLPSASGIPGRSGRVIAVSSGKGGGQEPVAVNLAVPCPAGPEGGTLDADIYGQRSDHGRWRSKPLRGAAASDQQVLTPIEGLRCGDGVVGLLDSRENQTGVVLARADAEWIITPVSSIQVGWGSAMCSSRRTCPPGTGDAQLTLAQARSIWPGRDCHHPQKCRCRMPAAPGDVPADGCRVLGVIREQRAVLPPDRPKPRFYSNFWLRRASACLASRGQRAPACPAARWRWAWWKAETGAFPLWLSQP